MWRGATYNPGADLGDNNGKYRFEHVRPLPKACALAAWHRVGCRCGKHPIVEKRQHSEIELVENVPANAAAWVAFSPAVGMHERYTRLIVYAEQRTEGERDRTTPTESDERVRFQVQVRPDQISSDQIRSDQTISNQIRSGQRYEYSSRKMTLNSHLGSPS
jgi:hypothetical protein